VGEALDEGKVKMITFPLAPGGLDRVKRISLPRKMRKWDLEKG